MCKLDIIKIKQQLQLESQQIIQFEQIDSTNKFFKLYLKQNNLPKLKLCIAKTQTNGQGSFGKTWVSSNNKNLYLSYRMTIPKAQGDKLNSNLYKLPLLTAKAVKSAIEQSDFLKKNIPIQIKWPNDLLIYGKKIGGILIELIYKKNHTEAIIGIGLNIESPIHQNNIANNIVNKQITQPFTYLNQHSKCTQEINKTDLIIKIIININNICLN